MRRSVLGSKLQAKSVPVYLPLSVTQSLVVCAMKGGEARIAIMTSTSVKKTRMCVTTQRRNASTEMVSTHVCVPRGSLLQSMGHVKVCLAYVHYCDHTLIVVCSLSLIREFTSPYKHLTWI